MPRRRPTEPLLPASSLSGLLHPESLLPASMRAARPPAPPAESTPITLPGMPALARIPTGLILSAGASSRMGQPKALLRIGGETFVERICRILRAAGCVEIVVVIGAHAGAIRPALPGYARAVINPDWRQGMRSSLRIGLRALPPGPVILTHVDRPRVDPQTVARLMTATGSAIPTCAGRPGHPVRLGDGLRPRLLAGDDVPLSVILAGARPSRLPVPDRGVLLNINTPADHRRLCAMAGADDAGRRPTSSA